MSYRKFPLLFDQVRQLAMMEFPFPSFQSIQTIADPLAHIINLSITDGIVPDQGWGGGSYFPYILLNEIQTMFSQLAKRSARVSPANLCTDHAHYVKNHRFNGFEKKQDHGGPRRDCFSLLHCGKSQSFWFYVTFQTSRVVFFPC